MLACLSAVRAAKSSEEQSKAYRGRRSSPLYVTVRPELLHAGHRRRTMPGLDGVAALRAPLGRERHTGAQHVAVQRKQLLAEGAPLPEGPLQRRARILKQCFAREALPVEVTRMHQTRLCSCAEMKP